MSSTKGSRGERNLATRADGDGFGVLRAPASGGGVDRECPDLLIGNGEVFYAMELKMSSGRPIYLDEREVTDLQYFSEKFGAVALVGARFDIQRGDPAWGDDENPGWYFFRPDELYQTDGGNYRVKKETALAKGAPYYELIGNTAEEN